MASGVVRFGNSTDHQFHQALNMMAESRTLSVSGLSSSMAGLFAYNAGRVYVLNAAGTAFELIATDSDKLQNQNGAYYLNRANHSGTQATSTISGLQAFINATPRSALANPTADSNNGGFKITNMADGTAGSDAATYGQLLSFVNNQSFKTPVRVTTTANIANVATAAPNTLDGVTLAANDRILVKDQTTGSQNGIYVVTTLGTGANGVWTRAEDFNTSAEAIPGSVVSVQEGTAGADKLFMLATNGPITLNTTSLTFSAYGTSTGEIVTAGAGLGKTGTTLDVNVGTGVQIVSDAVAIDPAVVARVKRGTVAAGGSASVNIVHSLALGTNQHIASLTLVERSTGDQVMFGWTTVDPNTVSTVLPAAPTANQWDWTVIG